MIPNSTSLILSISSQSSNVVIASLYHLRTVAKTNPLWSVEMQWMKNSLNLTLLHFQGWI